MFVSTHHHYAPTSLGRWYANTLNTPVPQMRTPYLGTSHSITGADILYTHMLVPSMSHHLSMYYSSSTCLSHQHILVPSMSHHLSMYYSSSTCLSHHPSSSMVWSYWSRVYALHGYRTMQLPLVITPISLSIITITKDVYLSNLL